MPVLLALLLTLAAAPLAGAGQPQPPELSLAGTYRGDIDVAEYWVSEKLDGVRARWDGAALLSRNGNRFNAPPWFVAAFPPLPLDGELWMGRGTFEAVSGIVRRTRPSADDWRQVRFMVFDLPADPADFSGRLRRLRAIFAEVESPYIALIRQFRLADHDELMAELDRVVSTGGEGLMLHRGSARYRAGRTNDLLKVKAARGCRSRGRRPPARPRQVHRHARRAAGGDARRPPFPPRHGLFGRRTPPAATDWRHSHLPLLRHHPQRHPPIRQLPTCAASAVTSVSLT